MQYSYKPTNDALYVDQYISLLVNSVFYFFVTFFVNEVFRLDLFWSYLNPSRLTVLIKRKNSNHFSNAREFQVQIIPILSFNIVSSAKASWNSFWHVKVFVWTPLQIGVTIYETYTYLNIYLYNMHMCIIDIDN